MEKIATDIYTFSRLRENGFVYVDKTDALYAMASGECDGADQGQGLRREVRALPFIPWVGSSSGTSLYDFGSFGYYWSSVPGSGNYGAYALYFTSGYYGTYNEDRDYGIPIRPVQSPAE